jgi:hypothetical protein
MNSDPDPIFDPSRVEYTNSPLTDYEIGVSLLKAVGPWERRTAGGDSIGFNLQGWIRRHADGTRAGGTMTAPHWSWCDWECGLKSGQVDTLEQGKEIVDWHLGIGDEPTWLKESVHAAPES